MTINSKKNIIFIIIIINHDRQIQIYSDIIILHAIISIGILHIFRLIFIKYRSFRHHMLYYNHHRGFELRHQFLQ